MDSAETVHRLHFAFTATFHYLFPMLTMGLAFLIVVLRTIGRRTGDAHWDRAATFWTGIFAVNFATGVVTGIPLEFQFGTNWAGFSKATGGVIGQTLALEGVFAFFLESTFLGLVLFGAKRLGPRRHYLATVALWLGTWLSGYFIVTTNAFMQHPVGYETAADGTLRLASAWALLANPWGVVQFVHTILGSVVCAAFVMTGVGAGYLLAGRHEAQARSYVRVGVPVGLVACALSAFPTGDWQAQNVAKHQPAALAAMEGLFRTEKGAPIVLVGQPDMEKQRLDNAIEVPNMLSFLTYRRWGAEVHGLDAFPKDTWPTNVPLLYYAYHIMVGLGTLFLALLALAALRLRGGALFRTRALLWALLLATPFPYIANTAGWITAETARQPWVVHGIIRTSGAHSTNVSAGNALFTLIGFAGIYAVLAALFLLIVGKKIVKGPEPEPGDAPLPSPLPHGSPAPVEA
jgi:cytochrome bd ubiquinol oxidase subunit I